MKTASVQLAARVVRPNRNGSDEARQLQVVPMTSSIVNVLLEVFTFAN